MNLSNRAFKTYEEAYSEAQKQADETGFDFGLEHNKLFREWVIFLLSGKRERSGHELRCQVVMCTHLDKCRPGHGP